MTGLVCNGDAIRTLAVGSTVHAQELLEMAVTEASGGGARRGARGRVGVVNAANAHVAR